MHHSTWCITSLHATSYHSWHWMIHYIKSSITSHDASPCTMHHIAWCINFHDASCAGNASHCMTYHITRCVMWCDASHHMMHHTTWCLTLHCASHHMIQHISWCIFIKRCFTFCDTSGGTWTHHTHACIHAHMHPHMHELWGLVKSFSMEALCYAGIGYFCQKIRQMTIKTENHQNLNKMEDS